MTRTNLHSIAQGSDAHGLNDHIAVRIVRISEALARSAKKTYEAQWGLKNTDLRMLNTLDGEDALPVSEIARRVHVDKAWVSRSLNALEKRGLVKRKEDKTDTRQTLMSLSTRGRKLLEDVRPSALESELALLEGIDARKLKAMLTRLEENAGRILESAGKP